MSTGNPIINSPDAVFQNITSFCLKHIDFLESSKSLLNNENETSSSSSTTSSSSGTSSWKLACLILSMLSKLKTVIEEIEASQSEEENSIDVLSIQSQILVQRSVELVIGFGVVPYLLPGLGVPQKLRKMNPSVSQFLLDVKSASPFEQFLRLGHTLEILLLCSKHPSLNVLIIPKYTSDILAGLLQICKSPIARPKTPQLNESLKKTGVLSVEQYETVMLLREKMCNLMANIFISNVPKALLINSLFLIGASEKPRWISTTCNDQLCDILLSSRNGLVVVSTAMIEFSGNSGNSWKLMHIISSLMRSALIRNQSSEKIRDKLSDLSEQCIQMITQMQNQVENGSMCVKLPYGTNVELIHIGLYCGITLMEMDFDVGKSVFWDKLFFPLVHLDSCQQNSSMNEDRKDVICSNVQKVAMCVMYVELLLGILKPMNVSLPLKRLQPVWSLLVQIFVACERYLNKPVQEPNVAAVGEKLRNKLRDVLILLWEIYGSGAGESFTLSYGGLKKSTVGDHQPNLCDLIMMLILNQEGSQEQVPRLNTFDFFNEDDNDSQGQTEGVSSLRIAQSHQEILSSQSNYNEVYENYLDETCKILSSLVLKDARLKGQWSTLFRQLLAWGTKRHSGSGSFQRKRMFKSDKLPTYLEGCDDVKVSLLDCQRFITFKLLGELGDEEKILEQFGSSGDSMEETLSFLELLLNKFTDEVCSSSSSSSDFGKKGGSGDDDSSFDSSQLIMYALGIIGALIEAAAASVSAAVLQMGSNNQSSSPAAVAAINKEINELWDNLEVFTPHLRKLSQQSTHSKLARQGIPEMASGLLLSIGTRGLSANRGSKMKELKTSLFQQAREDVASVMVHVKGHGLLELRRLIEQRDPETVENEVAVLKVFRENLANEDSYIYLMSIQGMAALALKWHKSVVPILIKEYDGFTNGDGDDQKMGKEVDCGERIETRMKVGEILVKVVQKLKEIAPSYRVPLTNVFFRMMRDEEPLIRASALANLGELCHLLKFSLGVVLTEVNIEIFSWNF